LTAELIVMIALLSLKGRFLRAGGLADTGGDMRSRR
jgi:hypothetical protein